MTAPERPAPQEPTAQEHASRLLAAPFGPDSRWEAEARVVIDALLADVERLTALTHQETIRASYVQEQVALREAAERERDRAEERVREAAKLFGVCDGGRYWNDWKESHRILVGRAEAAEARAVQAERERDEERERNPHRVICPRCQADLPCESCARYSVAREEWEARAQRYREALWSIASGAWMEDAPRHKYSVRVFARRALSADPLVCRDPNLCWGTGTCPRDPACNE